MSRAPFLVVLIVTVVPCPSWAQPGPKAFQFTQVDLKLLDECEQIDRQFEKKGMIHNDPEALAMLDRLAKPLLGEDPTPERVQWRFRILRDPLVNAFALPNGSVYVNTGLLALMDNEAQLAGVLAHEIAHVRNRHTYAHYRSYRKKMVAVHVLAAAGSVAPVNTIAGATIALASAISQAVVVATIFGYSRELEREADVFAVDRVASAGYDPTELPKTFKLLDEKLEPEPQETFYRSHPKLQERVTYTTAMASGKKPAEPKVATTEQYLSAVERVIRLNVQMDIDSRRFRTAFNRAQRLVKFKPQDSEDTFLLGEAARELGARKPEPAQSELTSDGQNEARKRLVKKTEDEEEKVLLSKPGGVETQKANQAKAEELYRKALELDAANVKAHRGLGMLYEEQDRRAEALDEYRKYLELAPNVADRQRIERRIDLLDRKLKPTAQ